MRCRARRCGEHRAHDALRVLAGGRRLVDGGFGRDRPRASAHRQSHRHRPTYRTARRTCRVRWLVRRGSSPALTSFAPSAAAYYPSAVTAQLHEANGDCYATTFTDTPTPPRTTRRSTRRRSRPRARSSKRAFLVTPHRPRRRRARGSSEPIGSAVGQGCRRPREGEPPGEPFGHAWRGSAGASPCRFPPNQSLNPLLRLCTRARARAGAR